MYKDKFITGDYQKWTKGMRIAVPWHRSDEPCKDSSTSLECKAAKLFGDPETTSPLSPLLINWRTAMTYDAPQALLEGLWRLSDQKCSFKIFEHPIFDRGTSCLSKLRGELKDELLKTDFQATRASGKKIKFDKFGDRIEDEEEHIVVVEVVVEDQRGKFKKV